MTTLLRRHPAAAPSLLLIPLILLAFWKLTTMQGLLITDDIFTSDVANGYYPFYHFMGESLRSGTIPLWIPYVYGGFPFIGTGVGVYYPVTMLLVWLFPAGVALNLITLITLITAAVGMSLYTTEIGAHPAGSFLAGASFAFSGFMMSHLKHVTMVQGIAWFPLGLFLIERSCKAWMAGEKNRSRQMLLWVGVVFGLQHLSGFTQSSYYSGLVYIVYAAVRLWSLGKTGTRKAPVPLRERAKRLLLHPLGFVLAFALALGTLAGAAQLVPTYELVQASQRSGGVSYEYATDYRYDPADALTFVYPYARGDIGDATYRGRGIFWEDNGYAGFVTLLLAAYAAAVVRGQWHVRFFLFASAAAFILVLGANTPLYHVAYSLIPGMKYFRFPTRFLFLIDFSLAVLASLGLARMMRPRGKGAAQRENGLPVLGLIVVVAAVADLLYFQLRANALVPADLWKSSLRSVEYLAGDSTLFRIYSPGADEAHKRAFAQARGWQTTLDPYIAQREFLQVNSNVLVHVSSPEGYIQLAPNDVVDIWGDQNRDGLIKRTASLEAGVFVPTPMFQKIVSMFNVKYLLTDWPLRSPLFQPAGAAGMAHVYRNPAVLPRAFLVGGYRLATNAAGARAVLLDGNFRPEREAVLHEDPGFASNRDSLQGNAVIIRYANLEAVVRTSASRNALLILSDQFYNGWKAEVDGAPAKILKANVCQRAVPVPAGDHIVRFTFEPASAKYGPAISLFGFFTLVTGLVALRRRR